MNETAKEAIKAGKAVLGIEFGSTRIKAVLVDGSHTPIAMGTYDWENRLENNIWTYSLEDIRKGLQGCYKSLADDVEAKYGEKLTTLGALGFSGMMHGYMPFNAEGELLVPFRTWRNTITEEASEKLTELFQYHIPQRWSIAHLYQAILNEEEHVKDVAFFTTLAGYIHWKISGRKVLGVGEASGMFPIDIQKKQFNQEMMKQFDAQIEGKGYPWKLAEILPEVLVAGEDAGVLTEEGAKLLDPSGALQAGASLCPPEGDAGTGMAATNSVAPRTGNVSAGTSVFAMVVLEQELSKVYPEIDIVTTPSGDLVGMVHCNNCTSDLNAWVNLFHEFAKAAGIDISLNDLKAMLPHEGSPAEQVAALRALSTLSPEDRDLLAAVQESPYRLTTAEQFLEFEKNVDCFVLEPHVQTVEALGWEYLEEKLTIDLTDDLRAAIDPAPFGRRALEEDRGCFTSRGYLFPTDDPWQHDRPQAKQADRKPSIRERLEQSKQECRNKNKAQAPRKGKSEPEL